MVTHILLKACDPHDLDLGLPWSTPNLMLYTCSLMLAIFPQPLHRMLCPRSSGWLFLVIRVSSQIITFSVQLFLTIHRIMLPPFLSFTMFVTHVFCLLDFFVFLPQESKTHMSRECFCLIHYCIPHTDTKYLLTNICWVSELTILKKKKNHLILKTHHFPQEF